MLVAINSIHQDQAQTMIKAKSVYKGAQQHPSVRLNISNQHPHGQVPWQ